MTAPPACRRLCIYVDAGTQTCFRHHHSKKPLETPCDPFHASACRRFSTTDLALHSTVVRPPPSRHHPHIAALLAHPTSTANLTTPSSKFPAAFPTASTSCSTFPIFLAGTNSPSNPLTSSR